VGLNGRESPTTPPKEEGIERVYMSLSKAHMQAPSTGYVFFLWRRYEHPPRHGVQAKWLAARALTGCQWRRAANALTLRRRDRRAWVNDMTSRCRAWAG